MIIEPVREKTNICTIHVAKLICAFVFVYADCWFSHVVAQLSFLSSLVSNFISSILGLNMFINTYDGNTP